MTTSKDLDLKKNQKIWLLLSVRDPTATVSQFANLIKATVVTGL